MGWLTYSVSLLYSGKERCFRSQVFTNRLAQADHRYLPIAQADHRYFSLRDGGHDGGVFVIGG